MVITTDSLWELIADPFVSEYDDAVVYADADGETVLHEGAVSVRPNGWVELPTGRLLSPSAVHHIDPSPDSRVPADPESSVARPHRP